jgi:hypothetical protein
MRFVESDQLDQRPASPLQVVTDSPLPLFFDVDLVGEKPDDKP